MKTRVGSLGSCHFGKVISLYSNGVEHRGILAGLSFPSDRRGIAIIHLAHMGAFDVSIDHEVAVL